MLDDYQVRVVDQGGTIVYGILNPDSSLTYGFALNNLGQFSMQGSTFDSSWTTLLRTNAATGELTMLDREVQIWRKGTLVWWGKPTKVQANGPTTTLSGSTLEWYLQRSNFGPIQRNYLANPDFEMGSLAGWTASGPTTSAVTSPVVKGTYAAQLVGSSTGADSYLYQDVTVTTGSIPVLFTVAGWVYCSSFTGPALQERGLFLQDNNATTNFNFDKVSASTGVGQWVRLTSSISIPAGVTHTIEVRLYAPNGTTVWDDISLSVPESVSSDLTGNDVGTLIQRIITYLGDPTRGKTSINLSCPLVTVGTSQTVSWQFDAHGSVFDAIYQFATEDICDFAITWNAAGTVRNLTVYPGRRGTYQQVAPIMVDAAATDMSWAYDGDSCASAVRVLGQGGGGSDQEVGVAIDTTLTGGFSVPDLATTAGSTSVTSASGAFTTFMTGFVVHATTVPLETQFTYVSPTSGTLSYQALTTGTVRASIGGYIFDSVQSAPQETPIAGLALRAATEVKRLRGPVLTAQVTVKDRGDFIGVVNVGDTVPVTVNYGWVSAVCHLRIAAMTVNAVNDTVQFTLMLPGPVN